jgi:hypothetical protein
VKRVVIESPYAGDVERNLRYLRACLRDSLLRGEAPFASHGLYTQPGVLRDEVPGEREHGIAAGFAWRSAAELTAVYVDLGTSDGMTRGIMDAVNRGAPVEWRALGQAWDRASRCEDCDPSFGCFDGSTPCSKQPMEQP